MFDKKEMQDNHKLDTLVERMNALKEKGFTAEFKVEDGKLFPTGGDPAEGVGPQDVKVVQHYRFEGESDPGDMQVLYAIETNQGKCGILTDGFGTYSNQEVSKFMGKVQELHKGDIY
jgi:hypothetical protein